MLRCLLPVVFAGVLVVYASSSDPGFYAQDHDYYTGQWGSVPAFQSPEALNSEGDADDVPHFPGHHPPKSTNSSIFTSLSENPEFSRLFKVVNISDEIVSLLNDSSSNLTFFAVPNSAIPKRPPRRHRPYDTNSYSLHHSFSLIDLICALESYTDEDIKLSKRPSDEEIEKFVTAILSYHIIPHSLDLAALTKNTTYATRLSHVFGALKDEALRLRFNAVLPFGRINFYSKVIKPDINATNGYIHAINRPLLPPPSVFQTIFLLQQQFSILSSTIQRTGLTDTLDYKLVADSDDGLSSTEGSPVVTAFVPSNRAFSRLPRDLQLFLFSPFGQRALKKLLQFHIVPDIALYTDWVLNSTSGVVVGQNELLETFPPEERLDSEKQSQDEQRCSDQANPWPRGHCSLCFRAFWPVEDYDACIDDYGLWSSPQHKHCPCFPQQHHGEEPGFTGGFPLSDYENIASKKERYVRHLHHHAPHPPPHAPVPRYDVTANFTLPTALDGHSLNVLVVEIPIKLPFPGKGKEIGRVKQVIVNGQRVSAYDGVALNGALHVVDKLISPKTRHPRYPDGVYLVEGEVNDWEDWEEWLPAWAEN